MQKVGLVGYSLFLYSFSKNTAPKEKVRFIRDFFGYKILKNKKKYSYYGLLRKLDGVKISNSIFSIPNKNSEIIKAYLESRGVNFIVKD